MSDENKPAPITRCSSLTNYTSPHLHIGEMAGE